MIDVYYSRIACNTYVMYNEDDKGFLVDPGYNRESALINHVKKLNKQISAILITHGHYDHIYQLKDICELYPNAVVYISREEVDFLTNTVLNLSEHDEFENLPPISYKPKNLVLLDDEDEIEIEGFKIKVIATPFHTKGSVCYFVEKEKAIFTGDTLFFTTIGRTDLPTGSNKTINSSLAKLIKLTEGIKVYPGHGPVTNLDREKKYNSYLKNI